MINQRLPEWFRQEPIDIHSFPQVKHALKGLHTVCEEAQCPNIAHCMNRKTATFLIMGNSCTRRCAFCSVRKSLTPSSLDPNEPNTVADTAKSLGLDYAVVTSVTRDDLKDYGAGHFKKTIDALHTYGIKAEVLIPDLMGDHDALAYLLSAKPEVLAHNIETVPSLYAEVRPGASYERSLDILSFAKMIHPEIPTKTSLIIGLGETIEELEQTITDIRKTNCDLLTIGQYLCPSETHRPIKRFYTPEEFGTLGKTALALGFKGVVSAPLVRSSYEAKRLYESCYDHRSHDF